MRLRAVALVGFLLLVPVAACSTPAARVVFTQASTTSRSSTGKTASSIARSS